MSVLTDMLIRHEGRSIDEQGRHKPYQDSVGVLTIGYGRNLVANGLREDEAQYLLSNDVEEVLASLRREFGWFVLLTGPRQDALADMTFNLGLTRFKGFLKLIAAMEASDYEQAAKEMMDSHWATQVGVRAAELAEIVRTGDYQS